MFDIGFAELLIVAVVALIVLGPDKLPAAVRTVGMWVGRIRRTVTAIQSEISEELKIEELKRTTAINKEELEKELNEMRQPFDNALSETSSAVARETTPEEPKQQAAPIEQEAPAVTPVKESNGTKNE
ncbi:MAG: twin-arginine translocase subunit TatB [Neptuniibacter caesariensis]|uniref:Sec-independent protein translocase protein TatB n=1 Tax=Neptuniibacter caesariensis TaxID=207954 RepID=A0A2G6JP72_NEPCE|nr:MAG: twin-arginine translocase subunit TatB [Neptuniibacter caesariensis]